jgi:hypothetical protein
LPEGALGLPGANYQLWSIFTKKGESARKPQFELQDRYEVTMTLTRDFTDERRNLTFGGPPGDSFIQALKPESERKVGEPNVLSIFSSRTVGGAEQRVEIAVLVNASGNIAKCRVELEAESFAAAERTAFDAASPFLSGIAFESDVPVRLTQIDVKQLSTSASSMTYVCPYPTVRLAAAGEMSSSPYIQSLLSLYREGVNSSSRNYQFLCWYKIVEGVTWKRDDERASKTKDQRRDPDFKFAEQIPSTREETRALITTIFPSLGTKGLADIRWDSVVPDPVLGWKFSRIRQTVLEPMRNKIAHMLAEPSGDLGLSPDNREHITEVSKWISVLRLIARVMIYNEKERIPAPAGLASQLKDAKTISELRHRFDPGGKGVPTRRESEG